MIQISQAAMPLQTPLNDLVPQAAYDRLMAVYSRLAPSAVEALPESTQKTALLSLMDRFNPASQAWSRVFGKLNETLTGLQATLDGIENKLSDWDDRFFGTTSPFGALQVTGVTSQTVNHMMRESIEDHIIAPSGKLLSSVAGAFSAFDGPVAELQGFVDRIDDLFADIIEGPGSLGEIKDILTALTHRMENLNLDFLEQELDEIFNTVKQKFDDLDPSALRQSLQELLDDTLDLIDVEQVLPQSQVQQMDTTYAETLAKLTDLNPNTLILDVVQPAFDEKIEPILKLFDLTRPIEALLERMDGLAQELDTELTKVDTTYKEMIQAVPR